MRCQEGGEEDDPPLVPRLAYPGQPPAYSQQNQGAYPPQPPGYVAEQQPYPAQPYPAQLQGYPQPAGYPATDFKQYPPDYNYPQPGVSQYPPTAQQQASRSVLVVHEQPTISTQAVSYGRTGDYFLTLSVIMTAVCCIFGGWWNLVLTIPAVVLAGSARSDASHGRTTSALLKSKIALGLNVLAVILYIVAIMLAMVLAGVLVVGDFSYSSSYYCSYCNADLGLPCYYSYSYSIEFVYHYSYTYSVRYLYNCYY
eukprot:Em0003g903a